jgi:Kef-type K+ transport system membrane component KefB
VTIPSTLVSLIAIASVATLAPLLSDLLPRRLQVPTAVLEIMLGIVIGPQVLGIARFDDVVAALSAMGAAFLFFLAGYEIDFGRIKGWPLILGLVGWASSLLLALSVGVGLLALGLAGSPLYLALAMSTTALGTLLPILGDAGLLGSPIGPLLLAAGAVGEFGPIVAVALLLPHPGGQGAPAAILNAFLLLVVGLVLLARRCQPGRLTRLVRGSLRTSTQVAVRLTLLLLTLLVLLAEIFGLDYLLGAFAAGIVVQQAVRAAGARSTPQADLLMVKYEAVGFGFLIPTFFVGTGVRFDLQGLLHSSASLVLLPAFLILFVVIRGLPVLALYRSRTDRRSRLALALFCATQLPLVITITGQGVRDGQLTSALSASLVGAAMASVLVFPMTGLASLRDAPAAQAGAARHRGWVTRRSSV